MNEWKTLCLKEMKEQRAVFIFLVALTAVAAIVSVSSVTPDTETAAVAATASGIQHFMLRPDWSGHMLWTLVPYVVVFILPFMFTHSLAQEIKGQTHYLLLSLPVSRAAVFLCKALVLLGIAVVVYIVATAAAAVVYQRFLDIVDGYGHLGATRIAVRHLWLLIGEYYFSLFFVLLGTACSITGLRLVVRRFQGLMSAAFFGCVVYLYGWLMEPARALLSVFGSYRIPVVRESGFDSFVFRAELAEAATIPAGLDLAVYSVLFGSALIGFGVWLFQRRAEA